MHFETHQHCCHRNQTSSATPTLHILIMATSGISYCLSCIRSRAHFVYVSYHVTNADTCFQEICKTSSKCSTEKSSPTDLEFRSTIDEKTRRANRALTKLNELVCHMTSMPSYNALSYASRDILKESILNICRYSGFIN